jgi:hypothetical protein
LKQFESQVKKWGLLIGRSVFGAHMEKTSSGENHHKHLFEKVNGIMHSALGYANTMKHVNKPSASAMASWC